MYFNITDTVALDAVQSSPTSPVAAGPQQIPSSAATIIGSVVMLAFFVEGLLGTILIMVALLGNADLRKSVVNVFVISLCANDLCTLLLVVDLIIDSYVWRRWRAGDLLCRLNPELTVAFTGCTLWHTALIAVHRYIVVVHPNAYKRISKRAYTAFVLIATRVVPFACCLPGLTNLGVELSSAGSPIGYVPKMIRCVLPSVDRRRIMLISTMLTIVPCVIVVLCYTAVLSYVSTAACRVKNTTMRRELRVSAIFGAIFLVVLGGFTPYTVVRSVDHDYRFDADVYVAVSVCYAVATCSSPLVYGALSTQIRQACSELLVRMINAGHRLFDRRSNDHSRCSTELVVVKQDSRSTRRDNSQIHQQKTVEHTVELANLDYGNRRTMVVGSSAGESV